MSHDMTGLALLYKLKSKIRTVRSEEKIIKIKMWICVSPIVYRSILYIANTSRNEKKCKIEMMIV